MEDLKWNKKITMTNADILDALAHRKKEIKNIDRANTYFSYSNTNYALLALVIEKISGKSYGTFMKERFFDPLKMENTFVYHPDSTNVLPSYDYKGQVIPNNHLDMIYGDKNIYSTTHDLLQWSRGLEEGVIFKPETLEEVYKPYSNEKPGVKNYGLGWRMNIYPDGNKVTFHNGWWHGNNAVFVQTPSIGATIIVLGNKYNRTIYKANQLLKFFIKNSNHDQFSHEE
jgi:CubicO group peptidase (beta-lactamase class C family)